MKKILKYPKICPNCGKRQCIKCGNHAFLINAKDDIYSHCDFNFKKYHGWCLLCFYQKYLHIGREQAILVARAIGGWIDFTKKRMEMKKNEQD